MASVRGPSRILRPFPFDMPKNLPKGKSGRHPFMRFAKATSWATGHPVSFICAFLVIIAWLISGPAFGFSDTWQLVINTGTTIITFLMVFLIQNTQNRDSTAMQIKLDELIRSEREAHNALLDLEELTDKELALMKKQYEDLAEKARTLIRKGKKDTGIFSLEKSPKKG